MAKEVTFTHDEIREILMSQGLLLPEETLTIGPKPAPAADQRPALFPAREFRLGEVGFGPEDEWFDEEGWRLFTLDIWGHVQVREGRNPPERVAAFAAQEAKRA